MTSPPSKELQQLKLSVAEKNRSQRQKRKRNDGTSIMECHGHDVLGGRITPVWPASGGRVRTTEVIKGGEKLLIHAHPPDDRESFEREYEIMFTVSGIQTLTSYVPRIIHADPTSSIIVLATHSLRWRTFLNRMEAGKFDFDQMLEMKQKLRSDIELLYSRGVAYRVKHNSIFPHQTTDGRWVLHLLGWLDAAFCGNESRLESAEWKQREAEQLNEIERIFELLGKRYEDMQDERIRGIEGHRVEEWNLGDKLAGRLIDG
ncbi:hypothetical protein N7535_006349 [Penicillium sp. DV-2018c]|nr:hypothetical protein N7461_007571 [Penicillium sp. DV-2018c]KAJ5567043.1 hypothetical protein N7535_006349 [Penicillium sp. DV-2018c]